MRSETTLYTSRNDALGFAARTRKNLEHIVRGFNTGEDVHVVTQLVNSLLGLVVFLHERKIVESIATMRLDELERRGWPRIVVTKGECLTLGALVYHLRNAVAHGLIKFSSDSRFMAEVTITIEDRKPRQPQSYWGATMSASDLREFCFRLADLVNEVIG